MKLFGAIAFLVVCILASSAASKENPSPPGGREKSALVAAQPAAGEIKFDMLILERFFSIRLKRAASMPAAVKGETNVVMVLEFTQDAGGTFERMRDAFAGKVFMGREAKASLLWCYFFDDDGVVFAKMSPGLVEGELTAVQGDCFRITQTVSDQILSKTQKISFRSEFVRCP